MAALAEERRCDAYRRVRDRVLDTLTDARVHALALKGAALGDLFYPEPNLRHSHDIDLLVESADLARASAALRGSGFQVPTRNGLGPFRLLDPSGLPVELHKGLFRFPYYAAPMGEVRQRARIAVWAGGSIPTLSSTDHLLQVCGQASCCRSRDSLLWACDAWYIVGSSPDLDWDALVRTAERSRLALPLSALLRYLADALRAPVPAPVLERLDHLAEGSGVARRDVAWFGVRAGSRGRLRSLFLAARGARERVALVRWLLLPSPMAVRYASSWPYPALWPAYYVARPWRYVVRRVRSRIDGPSDRA